MRKILAACAAVALAGCAGAPKARMANGELVVDSPFDLEIGSTEYAKMLGDYLQETTSATYDPKTGVTTTNWAWIGNCRLSEPYFGSRNVSLYFKGEDRHLHDYSISSPMSFSAARMTAAECRETVRNISSDVERRLGIKMEDRQDDTDDEIAERVEKMAAKAKKSKYSSSARVFCSKRGRLEKSGGPLDVDVCGLVTDKGKCYHEIRVSGNEFPLIGRFGRRHTDNKSDPDVEKRVKAAHKKAAKLRKTIAKVFDVDLDNVPDEKAANTVKDAFRERWVRLESPCKGMTERRASRVNGLFTVPIVVLNLRRAYDGDVSEGELEAFAAEFLAGLEKAYGGKLPTEDVKDECMKGLSTLFGDGVPAFGDSGTALQLDSKKFFVGRIGDLSIEITYAAPQFVKKGDSFELARKGAVVANILQTPMLVETPKK